MGRKLTLSFGRNYEKLLEVLTNIFKFITTFCKHSLLVLWTASTALCAPPSQLKYCRSINIPERNSQKYYWRIENAKNPCSIGARRWEASAAVGVTLHPCSTWLHIRYIIFIWVFAWLFKSEGRWKIGCWWCHISDVVTLSHDSAAASSKINHKKLWKWNTIGTCFRVKTGRRREAMGDLYSLAAGDVIRRKRLALFPQHRAGNRSRTRGRKARNSISPNCMLNKLCWRWKEKFILESSTPPPPAQHVFAMLVLLG